MYVQVTVGLAWMMAYSAVSLRPSVAHMPISRASSAGTNTATISGLLGRVGNWVYPVYKSETA